MVGLIFDRDTLSVAYLDCDVYEDKLELEQIDRHVLLPVEHVRLEQKDRHVVVDGLFAPDVAGYPVYGGLPLGDEAAGRIREHFWPGRPTRRCGWVWLILIVAAIAAAGWYFFMGPGQDMIADRDPGPGGLGYEVAVEDDAPRSPSAR